MLWFCPPPPCAQGRSGAGCRGGQQTMLCRGPIWRQCPTWTWVVGSRAKWPRVGSDFPIRAPCAARAPPPPPCPALPAPQNEEVGVVHLNPSTLYTTVVRRVGSGTRAANHLPASQVQVLGPRMIKEAMFGKPASVKLCLRTRFTLVDILVLDGGVIPPAPAVPASTRISARLNRVQEHTSPVNFPSHCSTLSTLLYQCFW